MRLTNLGTITAFVQRFRSRYLFDLIGMNLTAEAVLGVTWHFSSPWTWVESEVQTRFVRGASLGLGNDNCQLGGLCSNKSWDAEKEVGTNNKETRIQVMLANAVSNMVEWINQHRVLSRVLLCCPWRPAASGNHAALTRTRFSSEV
ncbi:LysM domain-containing protein [Pyricularia oryzae]|nr:LysM domain-containing protein [Pyricularia oryzae]KAI7912665.1 LysM domain-containing protein [Pyricularia oryzae]